MSMQNISLQNFISLKLDFGAPPDHAACKT